MISRIKFSVGVLAITALMGCFAAMAETVVVQVVGRESNEPLGYVKGCIFDADSVYIKGAMSDLTGYLKFEGLAAGKPYYMEIGRDGKVEHTLNIKALAGDFDAGTIKLPETVQLDEVMVEATPVTQDARKIVSIPSVRDVKMSMTTLDLLAHQQLPGLDVNIVTQSVSCYGGSVVFKVNGVPKSLEYVKGLSPAKILKFEYQDNPTEKYMGDGDVGGVINIVLKQRLDGGSVYAYGSMCPWMPESFINGVLAGSYNTGMSQFEVNYNNDTRKYNKVKYDFTRTYIGPSDGFELNEQVKSRNSLMRYTSNNVAASYTYYNPDRKVMGVATVSANFFNDRRTQNGEMSVNGATPFDRWQDARNDSKSPTLDLYFSKEWKGERKLESEVMLTYTDLWYTREYSEKNPANPFDNYTTTSNRFYGLLASVGYDMPIGKCTFSATAQESFSYARNIYNSDQTARLNDNNTSLSASLFWQKEKFSFYLMGRGMYTHVDDRIRPTDYWRGVAALQLNYALPKGFMLNFYGNYAPYVPTLAQLSTIEVDQNQNVVVSGNPNLKTAHPMMGRLRLIYNHGKHVNAYVTLQDNYSKNSITSTYGYMGNGRFVSTYENFGNMNILSASANVNLKNLFNHLDIYLFAGYQYALGVNGTYKSKHGKWNGGGTVACNFGPWSFYIFAQTPRYNINTYMMAENNPESGISVSYRWRDFQFGATAYTLFSKYKAWYYERWTDNPMLKEHFTQKMPQSFWIASIKVTYNLNFGKSFKSAKKGLSGTIQDTSVLKAD